MAYGGRIVCSILGLLLGLALFLMLMDAQLNGETTDCYDRHDNKIIGEQCIVEKAFDNEAQKIILGSMMWATMCCLGFVIGGLFDDINEMGRSWLI